MQRIVDRSDAKLGYAPASAQAGHRQRRAGIQRMRAGWSRLPQAVARLLSEKGAHRCYIFICEEYLCAMSIVRCFLKEIPHNRVVQ